MILFYFIIYYWAVHYLRSLSHYHSHTLVIFVGRREERGGEEEGVGRGKGLTLTTLIIALT